jgi:hypothetical protein
MRSHHTAYPTALEPPSLPEARRGCEAHALPHCLNHPVSGGLRARKSPRSSPTALNHLACLRSPGRMRSHHTPYPALNHLEYLLRGAPWRMQSPRLPALNHLACLRLREEVTHTPYPTAWKPPSSLSSVVDAKSPHAYSHCL